jgi:hypothetical protein
MRLHFGVGFYSALLGVLLAGTSCSSGSSQGAGPETGLQPAPEKQAQTQTAPAPAPVQQASVPPDTLQPPKREVKPKSPSKPASTRPAPAAAQSQPAPAPRPTTNTLPSLIPPEQVSVAPEPEPKAPAPPKERRITIPSGTVVPVRLIDSINTETDHVGQTFKASLDAPVVVNGETVIPRRADAFVKIADVKASGEITGKPELKVQLDSIVLDGKRYTINSNVFLQEGASQTKETAKKAGLGALIGAGIGAITGGKKGAAIGAGVGAGGGVAVEAASKNEQVKMDSETRIDFRLEAPLEVTLR